MTTPIQRTLTGPRLIDGGLINQLVDAVNALNGATAPGPVAATSITVKAAANGKAGTVTLNGATPVAVPNTGITANSLILYGLKTVGGTVGAQPATQTKTAGTGFTVAGTALDTSIYEYVVIETN